MLGRLPTSTNKDKETQRKHKQKAVQQSERRDKNGYEMDSHTKTYFFRSFPIFSDFFRQFIANYHSKILQKRDAEN